MGLTETYQALIFYKKNDKVMKNTFESILKTLPYIFGIGAIVFMVVLTSMVVVVPKSLELPKYTPSQHKVVKSPMAIPVKK